MLEAFAYVRRELGLDQMQKSDAVMAAIEGRLAGELGEKTYAEFKESFRKIAEFQTGG